MSVKLSTGLRNHILATGSLKSAMDGSVIRIYSGAVPGNPDDGVGSATLLTTISNDGTATGITFAAAAASGVLAKESTEVWKGTNVAGGEHKFFRIEAISDNGTASASAKRIQGTTGVVGADLNLSNAVLVNGAEQSIDYLNVALPVGA